MTVFYCIRLWQAPLAKQDKTIENKAAEKQRQLLVVCALQKGLLDARVKRANPAPFKTKCVTTWMRERSERIQSLSKSNQVYLQAGWNNRKQKLYLGIIVDGHKCNLDCCWLFVLSQRGTWMRE